jgi:hypothetical protein
LTIISEEDSNIAELYRVVERQGKRKQMRRNAEKVAAVHKEDEK